jgi:transcriptional regulator with XRE-family HTH domain
LTNEPLPSGAPLEALALLLEALPGLCREHRQAQGLSLQRASDEMGLSGPSRVHALEAGKDVRMSTITKAVRWLARAAVVTAAELEQMSPDERDWLIRSRMVTDLDTVDPALVEWAQTYGRALLERCPQERCEGS